MNRCCLPVYFLWCWSQFCLISAWSSWDNFSAPLRPLFLVSACHTVLTNGGKKCSLLLNVWRASHLISRECIQDATFRVVIFSVGWKYRGGSSYATVFGTIEFLGLGVLFEWLVQLLWGHKLLILPSHNNAKFCHTYCHGLINYYIKLLT